MKPVLDYYGVRELQTLLFLRAIDATYVGGVGYDKSGRDEAAFMFAKEDI